MMLLRVRESLKKMDEQAGQIQGKGPLDPRPRPSPPIAFGPWEGGTYGALQPSMEGGDGGVRARMLGLE